MTESRCRIDTMHERSTAELKRYVIDLSVTDIPASDVVVNEQPVGSNVHVGDRATDAH